MTHTQGKAYTVYSTLRVPRVPVKDLILTIHVHTQKTPKIPCDVRGAALASPKPLVSFFRFSIKTHKNKKHSPRKKVLSKTENSIPYFPEF